MSRKEPHNRAVEYVAPDAQDIRDYAHSICYELAEEFDESFADQEVISGLIDFMRIAARIQTRHLNQSAQVDSPASSQYVD